MPSLLETHAAEIDAALRMHLAKRSLTIPPKVRSGQKFPVQPPPDLRSQSSSHQWFITRDGWNRADGLSLVDLDPAPCMFEVHGEASSMEFSATLPARSTGYHIILAVWEIADTGIAFYQTVDLNFAE